jgi:O-antigen/teichoic acid export membrane protein
LQLKKELFKNTAYNYFFRIWIWVVTFFLFPFIVHHLGLAAVGVWLLVNSFVGYMGTLSLGIGPSLTKYVAQFRVENSNKKLNQSISTSFVIFSLMGFVASCGLLVVGLLVIPVFNISEELIPKAKIITYIASATIFLNFPLSTFNGIIRGLKRYDIFSLTGFVASLIRLALTLFFLYKGYGLVTLVLINSGSLLLAGFLNAYYAKKLLPFMHITYLFVDRSLIRTLLGLALPIFIINICMMIIYPTDRLIIGFFLPVQLIVYYEAAYRIYTLLTAFPQLLASAVIPVASELDTKRDYRTLKALFIKGTKYMTAFFLSVAVPTMLLSKHILTCWMGKDFAPYYVLVVIFILHLFLSYNHLFSYRMLIGLNRIKFTLWYYVGSAVLNLILSIILVQKIGLTGVVLATTVSYTTLEPLFIWYNLKIFNVSLSKYLKEVLCKTYPQVFIIIPLLWLLLRYYSPHSLVEVGLLILFSATGYSILFYFTGVEKEERKVFQSIIVSTGRYVRERLKLQSF